MSASDLEFLKKKINEIDNHIVEMINSNYMSDKAYTKITTMIGHIDDVHVKNQSDVDGEKYHYWVKDRLDKICNILVNIKKRSSSSHKNEHEDLMHPTGDYYNEDNSITLTPEVKTSLTDILNEKY